uniref:AtpZ/AtpI family protein n=1 Tax=Flavobacterium sp. TaxID=239 RepID=UPI00404AA9D1
MKKKNSKKWLVFLNMPFQMGIIIGAGVLIGLWLDKTFLFENLFLIIFSLLGVFLALYQVFKLLKNMNDE